MNQYKDTIHPDGVFLLLRKGCGLKSHKVYGMLTVKILTNEEKQYGIQSIR